MENNYILFIDSGIGGLTTLAETMKHMKANYIYFADNKYVPYGSKTTDFLIERLTKIIKFFIKKFNIKIIVLACNTATTTSIFALRQQFKNLIFVGTEPAYKVAIDNNFLHPVILATPQTIQHLKIKSDYFDLLPLENLANKIETYFIHPTYFSKLNLLKEIFNIKKITTHNDCLVLGCTHYSYLKESLQKITNLPVIDGNYGVSNRILFLLNQANNSKNQLKANAQTISNANFNDRTSNYPSYLENNSATNNVKIYLSNNNNGIKQKYKKILNQILANQIKLC